MAIRYIQKDDSKNWVITNEKDQGTPLHVLKTRKEALALAHAMAGTEAILVKYSSGWRSENLTTTKPKPAVKSTPQEVVQPVQPVAQPVQPVVKPIEQPVQQIVQPVEQPVQQTVTQNVNQPTQMINLSEVEEPVVRTVKVEEPTQSAVQRTPEESLVVEQPVERAAEQKVSVNQPTQMIQIPKEIIENDDDEPVIRKVSLDSKNQPTQKVTMTKKETVVEQPEVTQRSEAKMIVKDEINDTVNIPLSEKAKEQNIKKEIKTAEVSVEQYQPYIKVGWPAWVGVLIAVGLIGLFVLAIFLIGNNI